MLFAPCCMVSVLAHITMSTFLDGKYTTSFINTYAFKVRCSCNVFWPCMFVQNRAVTSLTFKLSHVEIATIVLDCAAALTASLGEKACDLEASAGEAEGGWWDWQAKNAQCHCGVCVVDSWFKPHLARVRLMDSGAGWGCTPVVHV